MKECDYKCEHYSAREDGMIMRHQRDGMCKRKLDNVWSFGKVNATTGYMEFGGERVHRIVATAFHGVAPSDQHVVDHIDTNRQNNRPENLRWLTKLENVLNNEITRKKVELICGSVEAFLENPQLLFGYESSDKNFCWMRNVTKEEGHNCLENWSHWAKTATPNLNHKKAGLHVGDWIFEKQVNRDSFHSTNSSATVSHTKKYVDKLEENDDIKNERKTIDTNEWLEQTFGKSAMKDEDCEYDVLYDSLTPTAKQRYWRTPTEFPCCPTEVKIDGLKVYMSNLKEGNVFSSNKYGSHYVVDKGLNMNKTELVVLSTNRKDDFLSWAISTISIENDKYVHENTKATVGKILTEKLFLHLTGQRNLTVDEFEMIDCL